MWSCFSHECRQRLIKEEAEALIKEKREFPERFMKNFNVPKKHLGKSLDNFKGNDKIVKICREYSKKPTGSLFFSGDCGCGKTHLAVSILREMVRNNIVGTEWILEVAGLSMVSSGAFFTTAPELLLEIRGSFDSTTGITEADMIKKYTGMPFLILDDLGAEKATEWAITTLYLIIDRRNRDEKTTIFTSNLDLSGIEKSLSARIASRLADCRVIRIEMPDYRKKRL